MSINVKQLYTSEEVRMMFRGYVAAEHHFQRLTHSEIADIFRLDGSLLSKILSGERDVPERVTKELFNMSKVTYYQFNE
jgi:hypothetical protein